MQTDLNCVGSLLISLISYQEMIYVQFIPSHVLTQSLNKMDKTNILLSFFLCYLTVR